MSTVTADTGQESCRREDFPVESFRYLESKLQRVRKLIMDLAAQIAEAKDPSSEAYRVGKEYIDVAFVTFLSNREEAASQLGIKHVLDQLSDSGDSSDSS